MILELKIMGKVDQKFKNEHEIIEKITKMFTEIQKIEFKKHQDHSE